MSAQKDKDIGWMYNGVKSDAHREDYLLGKRIDKNFEKYSDAVVAQKEDPVDILTRQRLVASASSSSSMKRSSLPLEVMRTEDPLVAIRAKEEAKRRDIMDNPLTKLRFQKMIKEAMDKKAKKELKKAMKKKKRKESSDDDDSNSSDDERKKKKQRRHSESRDGGKRHRKDSSDDRTHKKVEKRRSRDSSEDEGRRIGRRDHERKRKNDRRRSENEDRRRRRDSSDDERRKWKRDSSEEKRSRKRRDSSSEEETKAHKKQHEEMKSSHRSFDSHIPSHLKPGSSDSESHDNAYDKEEKAAKAKWEGYGLIEVKKKDKKEEVTTSNPYKLRRIAEAPVYEKKERKRPMTEEERVAKLKEMQDNAKWRDEARAVNLVRHIEEEKKEEKDADGRPASFVKPMLNALSNEQTMEQRLKTQKKNLQTGDRYMDKL